MMGENRLRIPVPQMLPESGVPSSCFCQRSRCGERALPVIGSGERQGVDAEGRGRSFS